MSVGNFIKDNRQRAKAAQIHLINRFEPKLRIWSDMVNKKLTEALVFKLYLRFFDIPNIARNARIDKCHSLEVLYEHLQKNLGKETYVGEWYTINQNCIDRFANATGDKQWIHTNSQRAQLESPFKTTIAHGFLTLALIPLLTDSVNNTKNCAVSQAKIVINHGLNHVRFPSPVKVGKRIRARTRVIKLLPTNRRSLEVVKEVTIEIENSSRPACIADTVLRLYF